MTRPDLIVAAWNSKRDPRAAPLLDELHLAILKAWPNAPKKAEERDARNSAQ